MFEDLTKVILLSDMDGTLLTSEKTINPADREAIEKFISLGGKFTVATGRTVQSFEQYRGIIRLEEPIIMYNGGAIYDYNKGKMIYTHLLPDFSYDMTVEILRNMPECGGEVLTEDATYVFSNTEYQQLHTRVCGITPIYADISEIPRGNWLKVLFSLAPEDIHKLELLVSQFGYTEKVDFVRSADIFLEMLPIGVNKGSALEVYRKLDGMEEYEFVSVGDFDNDIEMIEAADLGACPANAEESVKRSADLILSRTNDEGAIAELVEYILNSHKTKL